jgi:hypothetical protein
MGNGADSGESALPKADNLPTNALHRWGSRYYPLPPLDRLAKLRTAGKNQGRERPNEKFESGP